MTCKIYFRNILLNILHGIKGNMTGVQPVSRHVEQVSLFLRVGRHQHSTITNFCVTSSVSLIHWLVNMSRYSHFIVHIGTWYLTVLKITVSKVWRSITTKTRGLRSRMAFPRNRKFRKFPVLSIWEHPLPGPDLAPAFGTALFSVLFKVGKHLGIPERFPN